MYALFAQRESDKADWYEYIKDAASKFSTNGVRCAAKFNPTLNCYIIGPAVYDETRIFPGGQRVLEITGYAGSDPQADFGGKAYDPTTGAITDAPQYPPKPASMIEKQIMSALDAIVARLEKLEKK
jgi:hypothetical protein